jgi:prepilin-type N-terminal cleavage/methylation domain-containing protein/prepilin-type processing-associated H-X9-DG protein
VGVRKQGSAKKDTCMKTNKQIFGFTRLTTGGFTLIELLIVIAIIALLMGILVPALTRVRKQGKRAVCLSNNRQLMIAWLAYAETYDGKLVNGCQADWHDARIKENMWCTRIHPPDNKYDWDKPFTMATLEDRIKKLMTGALWPYLNDAKIYRCPEAKREMHRTYSIVTPMNAKWFAMTETTYFGTEGEIIKNLGQIKKPQERIVFVEEGYPSSDAFEVLYSQEAWIDVPQAPHVKGSDFGFVDGHAEFWKWEDKRTLTWATVDWAQEDVPGGDRAQPGNKDLQKVQRAAWGKLGYTPSPKP